MDDLRADTDPLSCLVELRAGVGRPIFLVHGGIGNAVNLAPLARAMEGTRPVYGLEAHGSRSATDAGVADSSVTAAAARYLTAARTVQPVGPYTLGGYSIGGGIALEMTAQLLDVGERVDVVVLLDAHPSLAPPLGADRLRQVRANLAKYGPLRLLPWARRQIGWKLGRRPDPDMLRAMGCLEPERLGYVDVEAALFAIGRAHQLRTVDVDVVLVKARELWPMYADDYGWSHWVRGTIQIEESPGDHLSLLRPSHVAALAEILRRTFR